jgi:hypothetical protein
MAPRIPNFRVVLREKLSQCVAIMERIYIEQQGRIYGQCARCPPESTAMHVHFGSQRGQIAYLLNGPVFRLQM